MRFWDQPPQDVFFQDLLDRTICILHGLAVGLAVIILPTRSLAASLVSLYCFKIAFGLGVCPQLEAASAAAIATIAMLFTVSLFKVKPPKGGQV